MVLILQSSVKYSFPLLVRIYRKFRKTDLILQNHWGKMSSAAKRDVHRLGIAAGVFDVAKN